MLDHEVLSGRICGAAIAVHRELGPGLLESAYEACLCHELGSLGIGYQRQLELPVHYKGMTLDCGYRMDLLVEDTIVLELKSVDALLPLHTAQLLTYLRLSGKPVGILLNFNVPVMKEGIRRVVLKTKS
ncbi:GxxExxY protein [Planctellipticum variicoloris]|uniref:GxxExxY protein n=1 Tax=Planctellipticum variicoloris TaxID=3064265 RepID=UPI003013ACA5|nr:GxxExxY protein [Planctomycetaceae bacterium SH412]